MLQTPVETEFKYFIKSKMDVAQHTFQAPLAVPPVASTEKPVILQQQSVIQSNQQLQQQLQSMHDSEDRDGHKRREILTRRPSYRKILDDLASDGPVKMENYEETGSSNTSSPSPDETPIVAPANTTTEKQFQNIQPEKQFIQPEKPFQTIQPEKPFQTIQSEKQFQSIQAEKQFQNMQMNGVPGSNGTNLVNNVVQFSESQPADNTQYIITTQGPGNKIQHSLVGRYPVGLDGTMIASPQQLAEEANRKREIHLFKNREAARECRRKKKEYVKCLENRVAVLENQNKALIEELKSLKDLYCSKGE